MTPALQTIIAHVRAGRPDDAEIAVDELIRRSPEDAELYQLAGVVAIQRNAFTNARDRFHRALWLNPDLATAHSNLAFVLLQLGMHDQAMEHARRAIALQPLLPEPRTHLGHVQQATGQLAAAIDSHRAALRLRPACGGLQGNLAAALQAMGALPEAVQHYRRALALEPASPHHWTNLGTALQADGDTQSALAAHGRAIQLNPSFAAAHSNRGVSLLAAGAVEEAVAAHRQSIGLQPAAAQAHVNLSLALLTRGDWAEGWREYEWRWRSSVFADARRRFAPPRWDGEDATGRTVLLHAEQGLGDTLQFVRYLSQASRRGGRFVVEVQPELVSLLQSQPWMRDVRVIARQGSRPPEVAFDLHLPLMSLPRVLGCEEPAPFPPYLQADAGRATEWGRRLGVTAGRKIGLVWAGSPGHGQDRQRSVSLQQLAALGDGSATFVSLQRGSAATQAKAPPPGLALLDVSDDLHDFAQTAALVSQLDAVVAVDTAVAHLAGAMGKPVALLLPAASDFRWGRGSVVTPWYPSMRLFRQPVPGEWRQPIAAAAAWLAHTPLTLAA